MSKQREALKLALEVLEEINKLSIGENAICLPAEIDTAMDAIREALAEPEQKLDSALEALQNEMRKTISKLDPNEMVWIHQPPGMPPILCKEPVVGAVPVCATPPARKSLTDEEIDNLELPPNGCTMRELVRAIERAHGIDGGHDCWR